MTNLMTTALDYASRGWKVFPCGIDKKPLTHDGFKSATTDPEKIKKWWTKHPDASIGAPTGHGFFVLDIDLPDGQTTLDALEEANSPLPPTLEQKTGSGGRHLFFSVDTEIRNSAGKLGKNIDIRGDGGYVILPPSSHESGNSYEWINKAPMVAAPQWLLDMLTKKAPPVTPPVTVTVPVRSGNYGQQALDNEIAALRGTGKGSRNERLNTSAFSLGQLVAGGELDRGLVEGELRSAALSTGLTIQEAEKTIRSGLDAGMQDPRTAPEQREEQVQKVQEEQEKRPSGLNVVDIESFLEMKFPPRETLLSPWLPAQGLCMVYAPRGVGKTHFSLGVAYAVASGGQFLQWTAEKPRGVLFIDGEMPGNVLQERISVIAVSNENEPSAPLRIITPDLQPEGMLNLSEPSDQKLITPYLEGIDLIIVDNLSTLCRGGRENEGEAWLPVQQWALQQRAEGRSVLFIHHAGKNGEQRGTSRREDVLDTVISLKRPGDYTPDKGACFEIHFEKARSLYGDDTKPVEVMLTTGEDNSQTWTIKELEQSTAEKVAALLNEGVPQGEIAEMIGITKGTVSKAKKRAQQEGMLKVS